MESLARRWREEPELARPRSVGSWTQGAPLRRAQHRLPRRRRVPPGPRGARALEEPIHLVFVSMPNGRPTAPTRACSSCAERGSQACVIQDHVSLGEGAGFTNAVTEVRVGEGATLDLVLLQRENERRLPRLEPPRVLPPARDSRLAATPHPGRPARAQRPGDRPRGTRAPRPDWTASSSVRRPAPRQPHARRPRRPTARAADELYKGILGGRSRGVFRGRVIVRPDAQKTDARSRTRTCCWATAPRSTPSPSSRSTPTTSAAATARASGASTWTRSSTCEPGDR